MAGAYQDPFYWLDRELDREYQEQQLEQEMEINYNSLWERLENANRE